MKPKLAKPNVEANHWDNNIVFTAYTIIMLSIVKHGT